MQVTAFQAGEACVLWRPRCVGADTPSPLEGEGGQGRAHPSPAQPSHRLSSGRRPPPPARCAPCDAPAPGRAP